MVLRWAPLQVSAHILQNLLLWWNLSATLRGCASFFLESLRIAPSRWQCLANARAIACCVAKSKAKRHQS